MTVKVITLKFADGKTAKKANKLFIKSFSRLLLARKIRPAVTAINIHILCMKYSSVTPAPGPAP